MTFTARSRSVRLFAATLAAAGTLGFTAACDDTSPGNDGGNQQEENGGNQQEDGGGEGDDGGEGGEDD